MPGQGRAAVGRAGRRSAVTARVFLNGGLVPANAARIDPADRGFLLGDGLFETIAVVGGSALRLDRHFARLRDGAAVIGLPIPWADQDLAAAVESTAAENGLVEAAVRLTVSRGSGPRGVLPPASPSPTLLITAAPSPPATAVKVVVATVTRRNQHSPLARIKSLNYLDNVLARAEAARRGADDAVLLNTDGYVAETSIANLFAVVDGELATPPIIDGALPGIMRAEILRHGGAVERSLSVAELGRAQEVFVTSALGMKPVLAIDGKPVGDGTAGAMAADLARRIPNCR
ncbi:MAG: 2-keto-4-methylthiobutyrate aminotransferase [Alphaproteobacteria bacterium]|nr:2-keto-4-methylthiobutyrate aminotransferase [Alphaproteobacteria bacterium]